MAIGRNQVNTAIDQRITDPLQNQNTAAVVRAVLKQITANYFNLVDDELSISKITGLTLRLAELEGLALNAEESDVINLINAELLEIQTFLESFSGDKFEENYIAPSALLHMAKNTNLGGKTAIEAFKLVLTPPFANSTASMNSISPIEKGAVNAISVSGSVSLNDVAAADISNRRIEKSGVSGNWKEPAANAYNEADSISFQTTYTFKVDTPSGTISASRTVSAFAPSYYLSTAQGAVSEALAKTGTKNIWGSQANRAITFNNNNERVAFIEPKSNGTRNRIMDQNGFNVTSGFTRTEANFTLADGVTTEDVYIYLKNEPSGNGSAFTFTFFNS